MTDDTCAADMCPACHGDNEAGWAYCADCANTLLQTARKTLRQVQAAAERVYFHGDGLIEGEELLVILGKDPKPPLRKQATS